MSYFADYDMHKPPPAEPQQEDMNIINSVFSFNNLMNATNQTDRNKSLAELKTIFDNSTQKSEGRLVLAYAQDLASGHILLGEGDGADQVTRHKSSGTKELILTEQILPDGDFVVTSKINP